MQDQTVANYYLVSDNFLKVYFKGLNTRITAITISREI